MLDIKFIRKNPEIVKDACVKKNVTCDIDRLLDIDQKRIKVQQELEGISAEKNKASKAIPQAKDALERDKIIGAMKTLDERVLDLEKSFKEYEQEFNSLMLLVPNIPLESVPVGKDDSQNVVLRDVGQIPEFDFKPKSYLEIGEKKNYRAGGKNIRVALWHNQRRRGNAGIRVAAICHGNFGKRGFYSCCAAGNDKKGNGARNRLF
jgi:seryl-tRNA synthetase